MICRWHHVVIITVHTGNDKEKAKKSLMKKKKEQNQSNSPVAQCWTLIGDIGAHQIGFQQRQSAVTRSTARKRLKTWEKKTINFDSDNIGVYFWHLPSIPIEVYLQFKASEIRSWGIDNDMEHSLLFCRLFSSLSPKVAKHHWGRVTHQWQLRYG